MRSLHATSPFDLLDRLEQQLSQQLQSAERVPAAEVHETAERYELVLELPGVEKDAIEIQATDRTLVISAERRNHRDSSAGSETEPAAGNAPQAPLLSEFRYGTWGRRFRFPLPIERDQLQATYRDGLLSVMAPKANRVTSVTVKVDG